MSEKGGRNRWTVLFFVLALAVVLVRCGPGEGRNARHSRGGSSLPLTSAERAKGALSAAKRLIQEAQDRYQRLPLGPGSTYLYATYRDEYGFGADRYEDFCAQLVAVSLSRAVSRDDLEREFQRVSRYLDGLLETYGEIGVKWNLPDRFSVARIDQIINDPGERELFKTALLADSIVSVWAFTVGYHYYRTYGEQPPARQSAHQMLTQQEVSERLRSLQAETE